MKLDRKYKYKLHWSENDEEWVAECEEYSLLSWMDADPLKAIAGFALMIEEIEADKDDERRIEK